MLYTRIVDDRDYRSWCGRRRGGRTREILITATDEQRWVVSRPSVHRHGVACRWGWCENAITRIVCVCTCARVFGWGGVETDASASEARARARIITKYRELIKHIVGARRLDNRYKLPPRAKQLTGETRARTLDVAGQYRGDDAGAWASRIQSRRRRRAVCCVSRAPFRFSFSLPSSSSSCYPSANHRDQAPG